MTRAQQLAERLLEDEDAKDFIMRQDPVLFPDTFTVQSSGGEITADVYTGRVVQVELYPPYHQAGEEHPEPDDDYREFYKIDRFDVEEFNRWRGWPLRKGDVEDILDIGSWLYDGTYIAPEEDHRQIRRGEREPG